MTEVVAWYAQDPTRMRGCYDRFSAVKVVPELPYCLQHHGIGQSREHRAVPSRSNELNDHQTVCFRALQQHWTGMVILSCSRAVKAFLHLLILLNGHLVDI